MDDPIVSSNLLVLEFPELSGRHSLLHRSIKIGDSIELDLQSTNPKITIGETLTFYGKEASLGSSQLIVKIDDSFASLHGFSNKKFTFTSEQRNQL